MYMYNLSFTSLINPQSFFDFDSYTRLMSEKSYVKYPWTLKESVLARDVYTKNVLDCTVCVISDGQQALMLHINPNTDEAKNFHKVEKYIEERIDLNNPNLQGLLLGANKETSSYTKSYDLFNKFEKFLNKMAIPYTALKGTKGETAVAYSSIKDEFVVTSSARLEAEKSKTPLDQLKCMFENVKIAPHDTLFN